jgi:hypothetical protein
VGLGVGLAQGTTPLTPTHLGQVTLSA